ncbi:futalosine hydrolase [Streptomyces sp. NPDC003077]|uniref:futalosine hydrolase n=1 Tax=Streptomyces sp. NPDC003077 TaxID=3154443 RepID=UPI0033AADEFF
MHVLVVTAVAAERDAVTASAAPRRPERHPDRQPNQPPERQTLPGGYELHRVTLPPDGNRDGNGNKNGAPSGKPTLTLDVLAAGVGPAAAATGTATALTAAAYASADGRTPPYDLVISTGIGGGFVHPAAATGVAGNTTPTPTAEAPLVIADEITAADLGAETPTGFLPVTDLGFGTVTHRPPADLVAAIAAATGGRRGTVLTGSTVTGSAARAAELAERHPRALAEAMEGFGVAEAAAAHGVPVCEIRAISNAVGPRDRAAWRIGEALAALTTAFAALPQALPPRDGPQALPPRNDPRHRPQNGPHDAPRPD